MGIGCMRMIRVGCGWKTGRCRMMCLYVKEKWNITSIPFNQSVNKADIIVGVSGYRL